MSLSRKIAANTAAQVSGRIVGTFLALLTVGIMTRHLGRDGYGEFTVAISFLQFFGVLVDFGLTLTMAKMLAVRGEGDQGRIASNITTLRAVTGIVFFSLAPIVALAFPYSASLKLTIAVGAFSFLAMSMSQVLTGIFQKHLATRLVAVAEVTGRAVLLGGVYIIATRGGGIIQIMEVLALSNIIQLALSLVFARKFVTLRPSFDFSLWGDIARESWPIAVSIAFNLIYLKGDVVILSVFRSSGEVGLYGAAYKVLDVVTVIPTVFMGLVLPLLTRDWAAGKFDAFRDKLRRALDVMIILALPLFFGTAAVARDLMTLVAGKQFGDSGPYLTLLMLAAACVFLGGVFGYTVVAINLQKPMIWAYASVALISTALYLVFIPRYGALAAAWVTVASEAMVALILGMVIFRKTKFRFLPGIAARALIASLLMFGVLTSAGEISVLLKILLGMVTYAAALAALGGVNRNELRELFVTRRTK